MKIGINSTLWYEPDQILLMPEHRCSGHVFDVLRQAARCSAFSPPHPLASDKAVATACFLCVRIGQKREREWDFILPLKKTGTSGAQPVSGKERICPHNPVLIARSIFHTPQHWHNEHTPVQSYIFTSLFIQPTLFVRARTEQL